MRVISRWVVVCATAAIPTKVLASSNDSNSSCPTAEAACAADSGCKAFGVWRDAFQLHGCANAAALVPNNDWEIFVPTTAAKSVWKPLGQKVNVDESKCTIHPKNAAGHCGPPPPPPAPLPYEAVGALDVGTLETSIFMLNGTRYIQDNIGCGYIDHWGNWPGGAAFKGHSYVRIRELASESRSTP